VTDQLPPIPPDDSSITLEELLEPISGPTKTYIEILASGIKHAGGLAQLARAEQEGGLWNAPAPKP
jgi:hypothetical protein